MSLSAAAEHEHQRPSLWIKARVVVNASVILCFGFRSVSFGARTLDSASPPLRAFDHWPPISLSLSLIMHTIVIAMMYGVFVFLCDVTETGKKVVVNPIFRM